VARQVARQAARGEQRVDLKELTQEDEWPATSASLMFPDLGKAPMSADGKTLTGSKTDTYTKAGITVSFTTHWNFRAERE
jgi:hypothetical protein